MWPWPGPGAQVFDKTNVELSGIIMEINDLREVGALILNIIAISSD
jgi:hypothetical protein